MIQNTGIFRKPVYFLLFVAVVAGAVFFLNGCAGKEEEEYSGYYIYCLDTNETKVTAEKYTLQKSGNTAIIKELLNRMQKEPDDISLKKAIPDNVKLDDYTLSEEGNLCLYWTSSYGNYTGVSEILRRAAIVKTLCQVPAVENVQFYVAGQPLTDSNMEPVGYMTADTFVDTTGDVAYTQNATLKIYFANSKGDALKGVSVTVTYDATIPLAQLALEQLMEGPDSIDGVEETLLDTIPDGTKINSISIKDNTCYLDLSAEFMEKRDTISEEVAVYSVVDTLAELSDINRVQFSIDGEQVLLYNDTLNFGEPFVSNLDLIER